MLEFTVIDADHFNVVLTGRDHSASCSVYAFDGDAQRLAAVFTSAADEWKGWIGRKEWGSLEGEFKLSLASDRAGHIVVEFRMRPTSYFPEPWELEAQLNIEAGQLDAIARVARRLWPAAG